MIAAARAAVGNISPFEISFDRFVFAPPGKPGRMIWLVGPARAELQRLKNVVEEAIGARGENRPLLPHITIARMREQEWRRYAPKPAAEEQLKVEMPVTEIAFMESTLKRSGAEYSLLAHIALAE
jgi:2'-5' RNA ligase